MKIEKITENKIRIFVNNEEIKKRNIEYSTIFSKNTESQLFLLELLNCAKNQVGFNTDGYKLLIEGFSSPDKDFVFIITKYLDKSYLSSNSNIKKCVKIRKSNLNIVNSNNTYVFEDFESFCNLCNRINSSSLSIKGLAENIFLYL